MKDKFRVRFAYKGWIIEHSCFGIFWNECGGYTYQEKKRAEEISNELKKGSAPNGWYKKAEVG